MSRFKRWLFLGAHPDDVELGCGGTIAHYSKSNVEMFYVVFSPALEDPKNKDILNELGNAAKVLGLCENNVQVLNFPRRVLHDRRGEVRQTLFELVAKLEPDLIFSTSSNDLHQDHALLGEEVNRIFRDVTVFNYEVVNSTKAFPCNVYIPLTRADVKRKLEALACYKSQHYRRKYFAPSVTWSIVQYRGTQMNGSFAEAFEAIRVIAK